MNRSHPAIKRLMNEFRDLERNPSATIVASPLSESNLFEWHFTIKGPIDSSYKGGLYHGRILFPTEYPYKAPDVILLTPNGRFEINQKICLNMTSFHGETWNTSCTIRTLLRSLRVFFLEEVPGVGSIKYSDEQRAQLAQDSNSWCCEQCKCTLNTIQFADGEDEDARPNSIDSEEPEGSELGELNEDFTANTESEDSKSNDEKSSELDVSSDVEQNNDSSENNEVYTEELQESSELSSLSSPEDEAIPRILNQTIHNLPHPGNTQASTMNEESIPLSILKYIINIMIAVVAILIFKILIN